MLSMSVRVYSTSVRNIHGPLMASTVAMAKSLGMNDSVISLICVAAWKMPTMRPTASAVSNRGAASIKVISSAWRPTVTTVSGVMPSPHKTLRECAHHQRPAVNEHEQHDLERQRDQHRRQHHHAHGHEHARD